MASTQSSAAPNEVEKLPDIKVVDDTGRRVTLGGLGGGVLLVQFVNPGVASQTRAVSQTTAAFGPGQLSLVLITKDSRALRARLPNLPENVLVVQEDNAELRRTFNVPACCERRFIFDGKGDLKYRDYYYEADLRPRLHLLIDTAPGDFAPALTGALNSVRAGRFAELREQTRGSRSGKALVLLFDSISTTCPSGSGCCGAASCLGPGKPSGCSIACDGGGSVTCCSNSTGSCKCGGGGGMDTE